MVERSNDKLPESRKTDVTRLGREDSTLVTGRNPAQWAKR